MRQLAIIGLLMIAGLFAGALVVSGNYLLGAFMGAILGGAAGLIVAAFPRHNDYPPDGDFWFKD